MEETLPEVHAPEPAIETLCIAVQADPTVGYLLGVECDGATYHSAATARDRDRLRQHVLEGLGWRIHRIWSTDWWLDPQRELEKLVAKLEELVSQDPDEVAEEPEVEEEAVVTTVETELPVTEPGAELASNEHPLKHYSMAVLPLGAPDTFYEPSSNSELHNHIAQIVNLEGPILEGVLYKRVARAWGLERTGSRIVDRLKSLAHQRFVKTVDGDKTFFWPVDANPAEWMDFRVSNGDESSRRHIDEVALEEVGAVMRHILNQAGGTSRQELARTTCKMLGMNRVLADAEARAMLAIAQLADRDLVVVDGDQVRMMQ